MFRKGEIIKTSDSNEYGVVDKFDYNNITYVYLVDINNHSNILIGKLENDEIVELTNPNELEKIINKIYENIYQKKD